MSADSPLASELPPTDGGGQLCIYGIDDPEWVAMILRRLRAGDRVTIERCGDLILGPEP